MAVIKLKRSATQGKVPVVGDLELGEIGLNTYDGKMFIKKDDGSASVVEIGAGASELEKITEGSNTGWRLLGRDPDNYGDIGNSAIDFSYSNSASTIRGATGDHSFAEGYQTEAIGDHSHAEGYQTEASGTYGSHAEGSQTTARGDYGPHAEGYQTRASGDYGSHAEGYKTEASGDYGAHTEGYNTTASGESSHAEGRYTKAINDNMHAAGKYNVGTSTDTIHETGIGADSSNRANAFEIYTDGTLTAPECTNTLIDSRGNKALVTKEYVAANASGISIDENEFTATNNQTDFILSGKIVATTGLESFTNGLRDRKGSYSVSDDGTDTTVSFTTGKSTNDIVDIVVY